MGAGSKAGPVFARHGVSGNSQVERLVLSVTEAAEALGVSDDLVYELTERGELPCLRMGRRKLIPRRALELIVDSALFEFDPQSLLSSIAVQGRDPADPSPDASKPG